MACSRHRAEQRLDGIHDRQRADQRARRRRCPLAPTQAETPPPLVERQTVALTKLIQQPRATSGLTDNDGSEQLRLEFSLPNGLDLQSRTDPSWTP